MALPQSAYKDRQFLAVIGDEVTTAQCAFTPALLTLNLQDSVTGVLLAGVGVWSPYGSATLDMPLTLLRSTLPTLQTLKKTTSS